ncbi:MAG: hypothetical protein R3D33_03075 [Hyphomicrobiaceae bacterium]
MAAGSAISSTSRPESGLLLAEERLLAAVLGEECRLEGKVAGDDLLQNLDTAESDAAVLGLAAEAARPTARRRKVVRDFVRRLDNNPWMGADLSGRLKAQPRIVRES